MEELMNAVAGSLGYMGGGGLRSAGQDGLAFTDVLDNIDAGIVIYDAGGSFIYVNTVMVNWRNIPRSEYLKMNVRDFYNELDVCVFDLVMKKKQRVSRLQYYRGHSQGGGPARMRIVTGTPIFDDAGNVQYVVTLLQDVDDFSSRFQSLRKQHMVLDPGPAASGKREEEHTLIARSPEILRILELLKNISRLDTTVILSGESGTGKEVFAHYIHDHSLRASGPMVIVNCAAIPENLIEAELFGYEKGSFTGASREGKAGLAEAASGGTLFLDEINSLPLSVQGKVLRMIEDKSVQRIGALRTRKADFRLIAATNQDLRELVRTGRFREDLYFRLNVIPVSIPPLRSRRADIVPLCLYFTHVLCRKYDLQKTFSEHVLEELKACSWPGNVRELKNFVERMLVMTPAAVTVISNIPDGMLLPEAGADGRDAPAPPFPAPEETGLPARGTAQGRRAPALSREDVIEALRLSGGRRAGAAEYLGISRRQLQYKIKEYRLSSRCRYES